MTPSVGLAISDRDLAGILALQAASRDPTPDGFVTAAHTLPILRAMHEIVPSVVARDSVGEVVAYALSMPIEARAFVPVLEPMFAEVEALPVESLTTARPARWYVMGQVAVAPAWRGAGVFDALYAAHRTHYADRFDVFITEVATRNPRSLRAHLRVGFEVVKTYRDTTDEWALVAWSWR